MKYFIRYKNPCIALRVELWHTFHCLALRSLQATLSFTAASLHYAKAAFSSAAIKSTACNYLARLRVATGCGLIDLFAYRQYGKPLCLQHRSAPLFVPHSSQPPTSSSTRWRLACTTSAIHYATLHSLQPFSLRLLKAVLPLTHWLTRLRIK